MPEIEQALGEETRGGTAAAAAAGQATEAVPETPIGSDQRPAGSPWWRDARRRRMLALADLASALVAGAVASSSLADAAWAAVFAPLWIVVAKVLGLYDRDHRAIRHLTTDELPGIAAWAVSGALILDLLVPLTPAGSPPAAAVIGAGAVAAICDAVLRGTARWLWRRTTPPERTLVIGDGESAAAIQRRASLFADMHLRLVAREPLPVSALNGPMPPTKGVDRIIVASGRVDPDRIAELSASCRRDQVKLSVISPLRGRALPALRLTKVSDLPVFEFNTWDPSRSTMLLKRSFDLVISALGLLVTAPLFPLIALAVKLDSRGPAIFGQLRAGVGGEPFRLYKFRTMRADAEEQLSTVVDLDQLKEPMFKLTGDPRVTRVGRFLRKLSLDELPQLYNVLRGDMSIVGPRPEQVELVQRYRPEHRFRLDVKPGLTGPMQVHGRGDLTFAERLAVELDYVDNFSLSNDLRILALTIPAALKRHGAY